MNTHKCTLLKSASTNTALTQLSRERQLYSLPLCYRVSKKEQKEDVTTFHLSQLMAETDTNNLMELVWHGMEPVFLHRDNFLHHSAASSWYLSPWPVIGNETTGYALKLLGNATYLHSQCWPHCKLDSLKVANLSWFLGLLSYCVMLCSQCTFTHKFNTTPRTELTSYWPPFDPVKRECLLCVSPAELIHLSLCYRLESTDIIAWKALIEWI